ncbi:MAG TPA: PPOX class F420-dependent oxidoreductase [Terriglobales bacterium]|nr:PPOX class F420-dependent oxidoreductase [Terriglobales bacterium]
MITFHLPAVLRPFADGRSDIILQVNGGTVLDALQALWELYPGLRDRVMTEQDQVREHINIFVGNEHIRYTGGLATAISAASEISIVPAISGGNARRAAMPEAPHAFSALAGKRFVSLASFRMSGQPVRTPLWFAEQEGKLYLMTRDDSWKYKRIRNNPRVLIAPCTARGRITGPDVEARARILEPAEFPAARQALQRKYWLVRFSFLWSKRNIFLEITPA